MLHALLSQWTESLRSARVLALVGVGGVAAVSVVWHRAGLERPDPRVEERERREYLASAGRIVDGSITETRYPVVGDTSVPSTLIYRYRIAGVTYECAQDVSPLAEYVRHARIDLPIQVRFDPRNPGDSIVVAEGWTGLRAKPAPRSERQAEPRTRTLTLD